MEKILKTLLNKKQLIKIKQNLLFMTRFFVIILLVYINFFKIIISISDY